MHVPADRTWVLGLRVSHLNQITPLASYETTFRRRSKITMNQVINRRLRRSFLLIDNSRFPQLLERPIQSVAYAVLRRLCLAFQPPQMSTMEELHVLC